MPEGPEIIITSQYLKTKLKSKIVESIKILSGRYTHQTLKGFDLISTPMLVKNIDSKGKFLWIEFSNENSTLYMMNTFGLTGKWSFHKEPNSRIEFVIKSKTDSDKKYYLYFTDDRNFGTVEFTNNELILKNKINKLAPDVLKSNLTDDELFTRMKNFATKSKKDMNLVKILMDQNDIVSGIGNYLVAEILYDAELNPHRKLNDLSETELRKLAHSIRKIPKYAYYNNDTGYMIHYKLFMKTHSDQVNENKFPNYHPDIVPDKKFEFKVYLKKHDPDGNPVKKESIVHDRTIHWVPAKQI